MDRGKLGTGELIGVGAGIVFVLILFRTTWFAFSVEGASVPEGEGHAFRWLDGLDVILLLAALVPIGAPLLARAAGRSPADGALLSLGAGLLIAVLIVFLILSPPEAGNDLLQSIANGSELSVDTRFGVVAALVVALAIVGSALLTIGSTPAGPEPAAEPGVQRPAPTPSKTSLATASADDLLEIGFTERQTERILSYRDEGIVTKVSDLKRVPGIAMPVLEILVENLED